jgi:hypothetical protein
MRLPYLFNLAMNTEWGLGMRLDAERETQMAYLHLKIIYM